MGAYRLAVTVLLWGRLASCFRPSPHPIVSRGYSRHLHTNPPFIAHTVDYVNEVAAKVDLPSTWRAAMTELEQLDKLTVRNVPRIMAPLPVAGTMRSRPVSLQIAGRTPVDQKPRDVSSTKRQNNTLTSLEGGDLVCRVIARSDGKLPSMAAVPCDPHILRQLDDIYHARAHDTTRNLKYMNRPSVIVDGTSADSAMSTRPIDSADDEQTTVATIRTSLNDAGFKLLSRRDLDLCEALNAGYLLRLSILPDVSKLDPSIAQEFYPEHFDADGNVVDATALADALLFDGRVLVFWRGYSQEVTRGRLLLPKLDFLQASLVQRLSGSVRNRLDLMGRYTVINTLAVYRKATACFLSYMRNLADRVPSDRVSKRLRRMIRSPYFHSAYKLLNNGTLPSVTEMRAAAEARGNMFKLSRYGGSKIKFVGSPNPMDALNPFIICEEGSERSCPVPDAMLRAQTVNRDIYESLNSDELRCPYDAGTAGDLPPMQLLERVSISNLVDIFTKEGRRSLFKTIVSKSELVEPTFEEVVVVWRPLPDVSDSNALPFFTPPKLAYELADMFDIEGLPQKPEQSPRPPVSPIEIRTFEGLPMANLLAVLPKTKLVFRPADAFVFDLVSILSFVAILGSVRFDNPRLDLIALVSVSLWVIRTVLRYSNKLARYDLLVKKFLTTKIAHRNAGALKYLATEAGTQKATRAALVHTWITNNIPTRDEPMVRSSLTTRIKAEINGILNDMKHVSIDAETALNDLEDLKLVNRLDGDGRLLRATRDESGVSGALKQAWGSLFDRQGRSNSRITDIAP